MGILKNPRDKIRKFIFKKLCQEDFAIGPLLRVDFGKIYFFLKNSFLYLIREWLILAEYSQKQYFLYLYNMHFVFT